MKTILPLLTALLLVPLVALQATEFFVSPAGDDAYPGTSDQPFRTIRKASSLMRPGDSCLIHGGSYRETVVVASGDDNRALVYQACPGESVLINGCELVKGWTRHAGNIYKAEWKGTLDDRTQVFINGKMALQARWPNNPTGSLLEPPLATAGDGSTKTTIVCRDLPKVDLKGASVWICSGCRWEAWSSRITVSSGGMITFNDNAYDAVTCRPKASFYVFGSLALLDSENEWFAKDGQLYIWVPAGVDPNRLEVAVKVRPFGIDLSGKKHVRIKGINLFACSLKTDSRSADIEIDGMTARHVAHWESANDNLNPPRDQRTGMSINGARITIRNSEIFGAAGQLLDLHGTEHRVVNCLIHEAGYAGVNSSCLGIYGTRHLVSHNTIHSGGRSVLGVDGQQCIIEYNDVHRSGMLTWDVGVLTTGNVDGGQTEVRYNRFHDNLSAGLAKGIFLSTGACNYLFHHNVVWNCWQGYHSEPPSEYIQLFNNTFYTTPGSYDAGGVAISSFTFIDDQVGETVINNIFTDDIRTFGHDVSLTNNLLLGTDPQFVDPSQFDFRHKRSSPVVGTGMVIPGITTSAKPDLGAYEGGDWRAGYDFANPPNPDFKLSQNPFANRILNYSFEDGGDHWRRTGAVEGVTLQNLNSDPTMNINALVHSNRRAVHLTGKPCGIEQVVTDLAPHATYVLTGWAKLNATGARATVGVKGASFGTKSVSFQGPGQYPGFWLRRSIAFTTGPEDKLVTVFVQKESSADGDEVIIDDIGLVKSLVNDPLLTTARADCALNQGNGLNQFELVGYWHAPRSWTKDDKAIVRFQGRQTILYAQITKTGGMIAISIDDGPETTVDTYYPQLPHHATIQPTVAIYRSPLLPYGPHVMRIRNIGRKNPKSGGITVTLYSVDVLGGPEPLK